MAKKTVGKDRILQVIAAVVSTAESLFGEKTGAEKKAWVVATLNEKIDLPWLGEKQEAAVFELLVDVVVGLFNRNGWPTLVDLGE